MADRRSWLTFVGCQTEAVYLCLMAIGLSSVFAQDWNWVTVLAVSKDNGPANVYELFMNPGSLNDAPDKELQPVDSIASSGNFKSPLLDLWASYRPSKVRLTLHNSRGLLWYTEFNHTTTGKDPTTWLTRSSMTFATDNQITNDANLQITFNSSTLIMLAEGGTDARLQMTWNPEPVFLVPTKFWPRQTPPLILPPFESIVDMIAADLETTAGFSYKNSSSYGMFYNSNRYYIGVGIHKTGPGHIQKFTLAFSSEENCRSNWASGDHYEYYKDTDGQPMEFTPTFDQGASESFAVMPFDMVVAGQCARIRVLEKVEPPPCTIILYTTNHEIIEAPMFAIQWWMATQSGDISTQTADVTTWKPNPVTEAARNQTDIDQIVGEIQRTLYVPKEETSRFKRQFYSVPDHRYSAVLIGSVGVISISVVVLGVLLLDSATILTHLKQLANNVRAFKARKQ
ncbi:hypothetical protein BaRGS_00000259 [Batillaria attramentaria]|uniref:Uncharacterized protein n=1 Tax=Batillaria attramentaria TaxID=370345 RepID=A0ABD0MBR4_9CAEN